MRILSTPSVFIVAVKHNDLKEVASAIENMEHPEDWTDYALCIAAENGLAGMCQLLLEKAHANPQVMQDCPLILAASKGHVAIIELLLDYYKPSQDAILDALRSAFDHQTTQVIDVLLQQKVIELD